MAGRQHHGVDRAPIRQAFTDARGRGAGRGDAGNDLESDTAGFQRIDFFSAAPEHPRITAFQPHDALAAFGSHHKGLCDFLLRPAVTARSLPNVNALGVTTGQFKDFRVKQPVIIDHIGFLQALHAAQGDQILRPRSCANKADTAARSGAEVARFDGRLDTLGRRAFGTGGKHPARAVVEDPTPQIATRARIKARGCFPPQPARKSSKIPQPRLQHFLYFRLDLAGQHRGCPLGADGHDHRITVHDRRRDRVAKLWLVDDVHNRPGLFGQNMQRHVSTRAASGDKGQRGV